MPQSLKNRNIFKFTLCELKKWCVDNNIKEYVAIQIFNWIYKKNVTCFKNMTNLSKDNISFFERKISNSQLTIAKILNDHIDKTIKFLFKTSYDSHFIETVLMKFKYGYSICISTELGCSMGCKFCASSQTKLIRKLETDEIVLQYFMVNNFVSKNEMRKITNVVFMGVGEPLDNYKNLKNAIEILNESNGLGLGKKHITVSTCGLVKQIEQFDKEKINANLAISLHAPIDSIRNKIMPINRIYPLKRLLPVLRKYSKNSNQKITIEYLLLKNINDSDECLYELIKIAKSLKCYVNLLEYNKINNLEYKKSNRILYFRDQLNKNNIITTIRLKRGCKINAACGQLRSKYEEFNN